MINSADRVALLSLARNAIAAHLSMNIKNEISKAELSPFMLKETGAFVSVYKQGKLRGCIGQFKTDLPLYEVVQKMAVSAATSDQRFAPIEESDIPLIKIEISVLTPLIKINNIEEIEVGKHGIYLKKGIRSGTYLPQVALNAGWTRTEFLEHCSAEKAGIGHNGWLEAEIFTYEAIVIKED